MNEQQLPASIRRLRERMANVEAHLADPSKWPQAQADVHYEAIERLCIEMESVWVCLDDLDALKKDLTAAVEQIADNFRQVFERLRLVDDEVGQWHEKIDQLLDIISNDDA